MYSVEGIMRRREFIDIILDSISEKFDIYHNYWYSGKKFVIYAYCYNHNNKYETADDSKPWETKTFEHLFFINSDNLREEQLEELKKFVIEKIEPHFVRGDGKYPVKHHMYSYISFIIITRNKPSTEVCKAIENTKWNKNYLLSAKGYSDLRLACVTPKDYYVVSNKSAENIAEFLNNILLHIDHYEDED
jgi:hypothetical protein